MLTEKCRGCGYLSWTYPDRRGPCCDKAGKSLKFLKQCPKDDGWERMKCPMCGSIRIEVYEKEVPVRDFGTALPITIKCGRCGALIEEIGC